MTYAQDRLTTDSGRVQSGKVVSKRGRIGKGMMKPLPNHGIIRPDDDKDIS